MTAALFAAANTFSSRKTTIGRLTSVIEFTGALTSVVVLNRNEITKSVFAGAIPNLSVLRS